MIRIFTAIVTSLLVGPLALAQQPTNPTDRKADNVGKSAVSPKPPSSSASDTSAEFVALRKLYISTQLQSLLVQRAETIEGQDIGAKLDSQIKSLEAKLKQINSTSSEYQAQFVVHPAYAPPGSAGSVEAAQALLDNLRLQRILLEKLERIDARISRLEAQGKK